jgi:mono/diheme cytochrome c family protein
LKTIFAIVCGIITISACKKTTGKVTYNADIKTIIKHNCVSCHGLADSRGEYRNYKTVKASIGIILLDITKGSMPYQKGKLPQEQINLIQQWQTDGLLER